MWASGLNSRHTHCARGWDADGVEREKRLESNWLVVKRAEATGGARESEWRDTEGSRL